MHTIYRKTDKGHHEIETRAHRLVPRLRQALIVVDGRRTVEELHKLIPMQPDEVLHHLLDHGFIVPVGGAARAAAEQAQAHAQVSRALSTAPSQNLPDPAQMRAAHAQAQVHTLAPEAGLALGAAAAVATRPAQAVAAPHAPARQPAQPAAHGHAAPAMPTSPATPVAPVTPPAPAVSPQVLRRQAVRALTDQVGPMAESLAMRIERAQTAADLRPLFEMARQSIRNTRGSAAAAAFAAQFIDPLG